MGCYAGEVGVVAARREVTVVAGRSWGGRREVAVMPGDVAGEVAGGSSDGGGTGERRRRKKKLSG